MEEKCIYGSCFEIPNVRMGKLEAFINKQKKIHFYKDNWDLVLIGLEWDSISDNETGREFKDKIQNAIHEIPDNCFKDNANYAEIDSHIFIDN
jgi:hypothetical protein